MVEDRSLSPLLLSQEELIQCGCLDMSACIDAMADVFSCLAAGDVMMSEHWMHGAMIRWPTTTSIPGMPAGGLDRRVCAMPAYVGGPFHMAGMKWYGSNPTNPQKRGWPRSVHVIVINDPDTGAPLAIMEGALISAMRTGACAGLGARLLAPKGASSAGIVGAGVISRTEIMAFRSAVPSLERVKIYDPAPGKAELFATELGAELGVHMVAVKTLREAVEDVDLIGVAASGTSLPELKLSWLKKGSFCAPLGGLRDSLDLYLGSDIIVDDIENLRQFMSMRDPMPISKELAGLMAEKRLDLSQISEVSEILPLEHGPLNDRGQCVVFLSFGMPIQDVGWATVLYRRALDEGIGSRFRLWQEPHWN